LLLNQKPLLQSLAVDEGNMEKKWRYRVSHVMTKVTR